MVAQNILPLTGTNTAVMDAVDRLVSVEVINGRYLISMPVVMLDGSRVDVSVRPDPSGKYFTVGDDGATHLALSETDLGSRYFASCAKSLCGRYGASIKVTRMVFDQVSDVSLRGAIVTMANLIREVFDAAYEKASAARGRAIKDELFSKLDKAFTPSHIGHDVEVIGDSTANYRVTALVRTERGPIVFDTFTKDPISIATEFTKLSDLSRLDDGPRLIAVTDNPEEIGPKLQLIASIAPIIRVDSGIDRYRNLAA